MDIKDYNLQFSNIWQTVEREHEAYAKSCGLTYSAFIVFQLIAEEQPCTQKMLCEITLLPKQTINSIVLSFVKDGYVQKVDSKKDGRIKQLSLTEEGKAYANQILPKLNRAEDYSIAQFTEKERVEFFRLLEKFANAFIDELNR